MKKWAYIFIFIISMFLLYTIPACGKPYLYLDKLDPVDDQYILTPGLELNADVQVLNVAASCSGTLTINNNIGIEGAFIFVNDLQGYMGLTLFGKLGPFYGEIGTAFDNFSLGHVLHTGLNGFFPLVGRSGPNFESDFNFSLNPNFPNAGSMGLVKGGWMWLFGKHSHLLIGGICFYESDSGVRGPYLGLVEVIVNDNIGPFLFDIKAQLALVDGGGADASLSLAFMPIPWVGLGAEFNLSNFSVGVDLKVRI